MHGMTNTATTSTNGRVRQLTPRTLALAALGLAVIALAALGSRPAPAGAQSNWTVKLCDLANCVGHETQTELFTSTDGVLNFEFDLHRIVGAWDDKLSAIELAPGVKVALYSDPHLMGTCEAFTASDPDLSNNRIGSNTVTSIHIGADCGAPMARLFQHTNYGGTSKVVAALRTRWVCDQGHAVQCVYRQADERADLREAVFNDTTTSIQVPPGQRITVWEHPNYQGRCETFTASDPDLRDNWIGNDSISSAKVDGECFVTLFKDLNGTGELLTVEGDMPSLRSAGFNDSVTSIQVPNGTRIAVYQHDNYTGGCETLTASDRDLRNNWVGNDAISSIRIGRGC